MKVNVTLNDKKVQAMLKAFPKRIEKSSRKALAKASAFVEFVVKKRTARGQGVGGAFPGYAASTKRSRGKRGRSLGRVDLMDTGQMLSSMLWKVKSPSLGLVFFSNTLAARKAMWHHTGAGHLPVRKWFDVNSREEVLVGNQFRNEFIKQMARA
jgi:hypothetical protein